MTVFAPLTIGVLFGAILNRAGLTRCDRIIGVYRFKDLTVLKFLLTAIVVGSGLIQAALSLGLAEAVPIPGTHVASDLVGGALFGIGMATAGFCPGTIAAGAGTGQLDYLCAGFGGLFVGALLYGWTWSSFGPSLSAAGAAGPITLPEWLGARSWLVVLGLGEIAVILFYAIERGVRPVRSGAQQQAIGPIKAAAHG
jgi:uncharacterized membrane protein YedE/YeeE